VVLLLLVVFANDWVAQIPMAALVAVMIMVSIGTFNWASFRNLREHPFDANVVMLATVAVTVLTHDLAQGVLVGVLLSGFFFAHKVGRILYVGSTPAAEGRERVYQVVGQVFFASADRFIASFDYKEVIERVRIDVSRRPLLGHHRGDGAGQGRDQVPPRGHRRGGGRPERGEPHPGGPLRRA